MWVTGASFNDAVSCHAYPSLVADEWNTGVLLWRKGAVREERKYLIGKPVSVSLIYKFDSQKNKKHFGLSIRHIIFILLYTKRLDIEG